MNGKPYWNDGSQPDEDHPRAGWYVVLDEGGERVVFGPFTTEAHAQHFATYTREAESHAH